MDSAPTVEIIVIIDGQRVPACTVELAAHRHGMTYEALRKAVRRAGLAPLAAIGHAPLYAISDVDLALAERLGRGAPGKPRLRPAAHSPNG